MAEFTYLLGAGASANTIPVVNQFLHGINTYITNVESVELLASHILHSDNSATSIADLKKDYLEKLRWISKSCERHTSIDTFARKLFLSGQNEDLIYLKYLIGELLNFFHVTRGVDKRYDAFLGALFQIDESDSLKPPKNINIISWNYDRQIEHATRGFLPSDTSRNFIDNFLNLYPRTNQNKNVIDGFGIYKLNGTIGGKVLKTNQFSAIDNNEFISLDLYKKDINLFVNDSVKRYVNLQKYCGPIINDSEFKNLELSTISYSWENKSVYSSIRESAMEAIKDTKILVVIGYSFPVFNRNVDMNLFQKMDKLERVYIQSPKQDINGVVQRFKSTFKREMEVILIDNVEEFYIPFEYN